MSSITDFSSYFWMVLTAPIGWFSSKLWSINNQVRTNTANINNIQINYSEHLKATQELTKTVNELSNQVAVLNDRLSVKG